jgi:hypothetical protein
MILISKKASTKFLVDQLKDTRFNGVFLFEVLVRE